MSESIEPKKVKLNDKHVKPDEYAQFTKQFKDNLGKAKKDKEREAQKLNDEQRKATQGKVSEDIYRFAAEIKASIQKAEAESMIQSGKNFLTLAQDHENAIKHKLDESQQTTFEDFRTAMFSLIGLYFKMVADFNHTFKMFASYVREFVVENTIANQAGPIDMARTKIEDGTQKVADALSDSEVEYNLIGNDIAAIVTYEIDPEVKRKKNTPPSLAFMITLGADISKKMSAQELSLLKATLGSQVRSWLKEEGYEKAVDGSYKNANGEKLSINKFNELRDKPLGLGHYLSSRMQIVAPEDVEELESSAPTPSPLRTR